MNRYFWLLMRFIGDEQNADERRDVYDRARTAMASFPLCAACRSSEASIARWGQHGDRTVKADDR